VPRTAPQVWAPGKNDSLDRAPPPGTPGYCPAVGRSKGPSTDVVLPPRPDAVSVSGRLEAHAKDWMSPRPLVREASHEPDDDGPLDGPSPAGGADLSGEAWCALLTAARRGAPATPAEGGADVVPRVEGSEGADVAFLDASPGLL